MDPRMTPGRALHSLMIIKQDHEELRKRWFQLFDLLQKIVSNKDLEIASTPFPEIKWSDKSYYRFHCYFTDVQVFCGLKQYYDWGCLCFGYQKITIEGNYIDQINEIAYFDNGGNVHKTIDSEHEGTNICMEAHFAEAIFPRLLKALKASMEELNTASKYI